VRLGTPKTPGCCGMEPAFRLDMLSADELAGQGVSLMPAATPPSVNQGLVLNGAQYAKARAGFLLSQQFSAYFEFLPTFNFDVDAACSFICGDSLVAGWFFKNSNINLNRLHYLIGAGGIYVDGPNYGAYWRQNQRNRLCACLESGLGVMYLNGVALVTANIAFTVTSSVYYYLGVRFDATSFFPGTFYDVQIYNRKLQPAEALQLTTVT